MKKVSIIVPVYNTSKYLDECVNALISQTYSNLEIFLVDDGSKDDSFQKCQWWAQKDDRIQCFYHVNHGVSYTRNFAIKKATGEYLAFIDSDDIVSSQFIELLVKHMEEFQADCSVCGIQSFYKTVTIPNTHEENIICYHSELQEKLFADVGGFLANKLYKADIIRKNHLQLHEDIAISEDLLFNMDYFAHCSSLVYDSNIHYFYRQYATSSFLNLQNTKWFSVLDTYLYILEHISLSSHLRNLILYHFNLILVEAKYRFKKCPDCDLKMIEKINTLQKEYYMVPKGKKQRLKLFIFRHFPGFVMFYKRRKLRGESR